MPARSSSCADAATTPKPRSRRRKAEAVAPLAAEPVLPAVAQVAERPAMPRLAAGVVDEAITPLEIMLITMRELWMEARLGVEGVDEAKRMQAVTLAQKVAPYVHAKAPSAKAAAGADEAPPEATMEADLALVLRQLSGAERQALMPVLARVAHADRP